MPLKRRLHIETVIRDKRTVLKNSFCTQPFKIANITEEKSLPPLRLMLMSSSPGILDGDHYDISIDIGTGCQVSVETQSYQRLFQMKTGASQTMTVTMEQGSSFCYLPHPVVPHQQAIFRSKTKICLQENCSLLWGEVISCGRKLNGEVFQLTSFHGLTEIYRKEKLVVKENLLIWPAKINPAAIGQLEGFTHQATLLYLDEKAPVGDRTNELVEKLRRESGIAFGVSALPVNGLVVRMLGHKAEPLYLLVKVIASLLQGAKESLNKTQKAYVQ